MGAAEALSAVEGEREKRDDKAHAGQCNYHFDHARKYETRVPNAE